MLIDLGVFSRDPTRTSLTEPLDDVVLSSILPDVLKVLDTFVLSKLSYSSEFPLVRVPDKTGGNPSTFREFELISFDVVECSTKLLPKRTDFENGDEVVPNWAFDESWEATEFTLSETFKFVFEACKF